MLTCGGERWSRSRAMVAAGVLALTAGCATENAPPVPVRIDDGNASVRAARLIWRPPGDSTVVAQRGGIELDYAMLSGGGSQSLAGGERIVLEGRIDGPQAVRHEVRTRYRHLVYNHLIPTNLRILGGDRIEVEALIGVGRVELQVRSQGDAPGAVPFAWNYPLGGFVAGIAPRWVFNDRLALELRFTRLFEIPFLDTTSWGLSDIALAFRPVRHVTLRAGYLAAQASVVDNLDVISPVEAKLRGPYLGATLDF